MKKLLILGASILQLPAIKKAKEMGLYVAVADFNPNAIGIQYADEYYNASTIDENAICDVARRFNPDGIMTLATDMPMRAIAKATEMLGLPGISYDTAVKATDKGEMIKAFERHNVEHPWYYIVKSSEYLKSILSQITYPCVMKPTDNAGNRGVCYVANEEELLKMYSYSFDNSRSGDVIIEEYMEGQEVSVEVMVIDSVVHIVAVTDKQTLGKPYFVEVGHSQPSKHSERDLCLIKDLATRAVQAVGINNSPAHVEIMLTAQGPKMVELGARLGGGCITTHLVPLSTGVDMIQCVIDLALGQKPNVTPKFQKGSALLHLAYHEGKNIQEIFGIEEASNSPGVVEVTMLKTVGDDVQYFMNGSDRIGYVITQGDNVTDALSKCQDALNKIKIITH